MIALWVERGSPRARRSPAAPSSTRWRWPCTAPPGPTTAASAARPPRGRCSSPSTSDRPSRSSCGRGCCASWCGSRTPTASPASPTSSPPATARATCWRPSRPCSRVVGTMPYIALQLKAVIDTFTQLTPCRRDPSDAWLVANVGKIVVVLMTIFTIVIGRAAPRPDRAPRGAAARARRRVRGQAGRLRHASASSSPSSCSTASATCSQRLADSPFKRPPGQRPGRVSRRSTSSRRYLVLAHVGHPVPAAAVPRRRRGELQRDATCARRMWLLPLYLLLINLFVMPIATAAWSSGCPSARPTRSCWACRCARAAWGSACSSSSAASRRRPA